MDIDRSTASLFVLRRSWLIGVCTKRDVERAFGLGASPATVARLMKNAVNDYPRQLWWEKRHGVRPRPEAMRPQEVSAQTMLDLLARHTQPQITGLFEEESSVILRPSKIFGLAATTQANELILDAVLRGRALRILYVGMRRGEEPRWRTVVPCALEYTGMYWRLRAQDIEDGDRNFPIKSYVMYRILDAQPHAQPLPSSFRRRSLMQTQCLLRVFLSDQLSEHQAQALKRGLQIADNGLMTWPVHSLYEFKREYGGYPTAKDVVWPPLARIDEVD